MGKASKTTDIVLAFLERNRGKYVSGTEMAEACGISRNAIWKAVKELRESGYVIEAVSNKGYSLGSGNDIISAEGIKANMEPSVAEAVNICVYDTIESTSDVAKEMALKGAGHGTMVVSAKQTRGRGRKDHEFFSPAGGLYMSMILSPKKLKATDNESVTTEIGNAVRDAIKDLTGVVSERKGINDLFVGEKKICGILIESGSEFDSGTLQWLVVGIGINFDSDISVFPASLRGKASSLFKPGSASITKNELIAAIAGRILA
ncbi:MAG: biotin--[acetyl-CoA-carboxylase] ligase [Lachnospiraceae bacterium]|nr:biotin--[acetyl-CoA-carboxylase] ligase [Lachnospiraceae bacterium]